MSSYGVFEVDLFIKGKNLHTQWTWLRS
jgi:hypothetical protein